MGLQIMIYFIMDDIYRLVVIIDPPADIRSDPKGGWKMEDQEGW